jgi:Protein phosphatase 2C
MTHAWVWAGARVAGTSHLKQGVPCQDSFACRVWRRDDRLPVLVAALADGAGSADRAEVGSALATALFVDIVCEALDGSASVGVCTETLRYAIGETRLALHLKACHDDRTADDYASTFLAAILSPAGGAVGQIGDGATVISDRSNGWYPVHWPDHGEYANTTNFLTQSDALDTLRVASFDAPVKHLAMFSDGLERLLLDFRRRSAHAPSFDSIFSSLNPSIGSGHAARVSENLAVLLASDKVNARTNDDKSLLCAALVET